VVEPIGALLPGGEQVLRAIGRGAMAEVYLASDGRAVRVLKLLPHGQAPRARHEYDIACALAHRHLGRVDELVEVAGRPGLVMPFVPGRRLVTRNRSARGRDAYLEAFAGLLAGLAELHTRGVVHRDVKPENVLVDARGVAVLIDFDLAVRLGSEEPPPGLAGTLAYLSPEQARGEPSVPASDLYAAGVMLYGALTGEVPFTGTIAEVVTAHRDAVIRPASQIDSSLAQFDAYLARLLAKDPADRFVDGGAALAALRAFAPVPRVVGHLPRARRMTG
jgi:eukaryotic-like serine/threonine-protein kinase